MFRTSLLAGVTLLLAAPATRADPLRCVPPTAQIVLVSDTPRKLAEAVTGLDALRAAQKLPQYRPIYDSAAARRGFQLLALFEAELGAQWPALLDQLAGNGVALGFQFGPDPAPAVLVLEGTNAEQVKKATELALKTVEEELARQGAKGAVKRYELAGTAAVKIGDFYAARVGATTIVSNTEAALKTAGGGGGGGGGARRNPGPAATPSRCSRTAHWRGCGSTSPP